MSSLRASARTAGVALDAVRERGRRGGRFGEHFLADLDFADDGAGVCIVTAFECDERRADVRDVMDVAVEARDAAGVGGGNVDDRLGGLDRQQRLVELDLVAGLDVPFDDFRFLQAFAEIG